MFLSNSATCSPIQIELRPMFSARRPKSRIICGVAWGDMNVEKTPIFICVSSPVRLLHGHGRPEPDFEAKSLSIFLLNRRRTCDGRVPINALENIDKAFR